MQPMTVQEIAAAVGGVWRNPRADAPAVSAVSTDSRKIQPGCLFLPWVGEKFDGHDFIEGALASGAAGCICARLPAALRPDKFYIEVPDTRLALRALASACRDKFPIPFVQITGSVGKTTTKEMISAVLGARLRVYKTPGNFNNDIGTPLTLLGLAPEHQAAVIETGMNHFGEIRYLGEMVRPDIAVISNIGDAHVEFLGSREGILQAKCEILENLKPGGLLVLNGDDALLDTVQTSFRTVRCGQSEHCQARITELIDHGVEGITCTVTTEKDVYRLSIPAPGEHMAYSASMAVAVAEELGLSREEIIRGVGGYEPRRVPDAGGAPAGQAADPGRLLQRKPPVRHGGAGGAGKDRVRPEGGRAGGHGGAGEPDGSGPLQRGRPGGHAGDGLHDRHRREGCPHRRRRRGERRNRSALFHKRGGSAGAAGAAGAGHGRAGEGVPRHAL